MGEELNLPHSPILPSSPTSPLSPLLPSSKGSSLLPFPGFGYVSPSPRQAFF